MTCSCMLLPFYIFVQFALIFLFHILCSLPVSGSLLKKECKTHVISLSSLRDRIMADYEDYEDLSFLDFNEFTRQFEKEDEFTLQFEKEEKGKGKI